MKPDKPFWVPDTQGFLAIAIIGLVGFVVCLLLYKPVAVENKDILNIALGVLLGSLKDVYSFFFGSSKGSEKKDDALISGAVSPTSTPPIVPPSQPISVTDAPAAASPALKGLAFVAIIATSLLVLGGDARAQPRAARTTTHGLPCDPANLLPGCQPTAGASNPATSAIASLLSKPMQDLANFITNGFDNAVDLSTAVPELQDGNGQACWSMMRNYSVILKDHPIPVTLQAAYDLEAIRLLNMAANKICQNAACTQVFTEAGNLVNAAAPLGMPLPNLTALCSKVPDIAVVAATPSPTPLPTIVVAPSPTPTPDATPSK